MPIRALALAAVLSAGPAHADALLDRLLADARASGADEFAWTRTTRTEQRHGGETKVRTVIQRYDPSLPPARRWTLVSIDGRAPTADERAEYDKGRIEAQVPSYGRIAGYLNARMQRSDAAGRPVYRGVGMPKGMFMVNKHDLSAKAGVEAHVAEGLKPYVEQVKLVSGEPFRMMLVAKVDRVEGITRYKLMPDGRPVIAEQEMVTTGSMMGKSGTIRSISTYSDHRAVRAGG